MTDQLKRIAILGSGPAALMAASEFILEQKRLKKNSAEIHIFEKRSGFGRKLLIAGSSGLNISHHLPPLEFARHYEGWDHAYWSTLLTQYGPKDWVHFIENSLGLETFIGTSNRYFVKEMKASRLLKQWLSFLEAHGVQLHSQHELTDFHSSADGIELSFKNQETKGNEFFRFDKVAALMGGGSWEEETPSWPELFKSKGLEVLPFQASNVGYEIDWAAPFLKESEGKPLKKIDLTTSRGTKRGELVITQYGIEGTPVYFCGIPGPATLDLKPDLTHSQILEKLSRSKENLSPMRRVKKFLSLSEASESLLFHHSPPEVKASLPALINYLKQFPLNLKSARPLKEAISSKGGLALSELTNDFQLKAFPRIYCGGEMLNWDAPTGGFLIQASVSQGAIIGRILAQSLPLTADHFSDHQD